MELECQHIVELEHCLDSMSAGYLAHAAVMVDKGGRAYNRKQRGMSRQIKKLKFKQ